MSRFIPAAALSLCLPLASLTGACVEQSPDSPTEEDVKAAREHILDKAPTPKFPSGAVLTAPPGQGKGKLIYLGTDIDEPKITAGKAFTLTHYFQVEERVSEDWRLFVHLDAPGDRRTHLNADHVPIGGKYPIPMWKKGEIIRDIHKASVPATWPADKVAIYVGVWKGQVRFRVEGGQKDSDSRVVAMTIPVQGGTRESSGAPATKRLVARRLKAGTAINVDGKLDEPAWKEAASTGPFVHTMSGAPAEQAAEARVLWDDKGLYIAFDFADKDVWGTFEKHDDKLWTQEAAEIFLDADGDGKTYVELQVSPRNTTFDSWLPAYRQNDNAWDAPIKTAVQVNGTLNKRDDADKGWTVEVMIPIGAARGKLAEMRNVPPQVGTEWRVNFFRMDMPAGKAQAASSWSPPMVGDFHALDKFGTLVFGDEQGNAPTANAAVAPPVPLGTTPSTGPISPITRKLMLARPVAKPGAEASKAEAAKVQSAEAAGEPAGAKKAPATDEKAKKGKK